MSTEVNTFNESMLRQEFCDSVGHTKECINETLDDMLQLMAKVAYVNGIPQYLAEENYMKNITVEAFEEHLLKILNQKECECDRLDSTSTH